MGHGTHLLNLLPILRWPFSRHVDDSTIEPDLNAYAKVIQMKKEMGLLERWDKG